MVYFAQVVCVYLIARVAYFVRPIYSIAVYLIRGIREF
jgi:hypothetical protein